MLLKSFEQYPIKRYETLAIISNKKGRGMPEKSYDEVIRQNTTNWQFIMPLNKKIWRLRIKIELSYIIEYV